VPVGGVGFASHVTSCMSCTISFAIPNW